VTDKKKILIVEDFDDSRKLLALCIGRLGYDISEAVDGIEGLQQAAALHPDLIIMDISMPRMDGLEATIRLKADPATRGIPVVITTAHIQKSLIDGALELGASEVLIKPINLMALREMIGRQLLRTDQAVAPMLIVATEHDRPKFLESH
jgi:CheY-like chemotaxis protein